MSYRFKTGLQYLMPTHFGPVSGPRQGPDGSRWPVPDERIKESYAATFDGETAELEALLPEGFALDGTPRLTVTYSYQTGIGWLAGRGYNMLAVTVPAYYSARAVSARGPFLLVLWENMAEPIMTGREQLGFSKIFCELPPPVARDGRVACSAAWMGHTFMELEVSELQAVDRPVERSEQSTPERSEQSTPERPDAELTGMLHLRYLPQLGARSGHDPEASLVEPVLTPSEATAETLLEQKRGAGRLRILPTTWQDMPTQFQIVEGLRSLRLRPSGPAIYRRVRGSGDLFEQRSLIL